MMAMFGWEVEGAVLSDWVGADGRTGECGLPC